MGHLPVDISIERDNVRFYAPIATSLLHSLILIIVLNLLARHWPGAPGLVNGTSGTPRPRCSFGGVAEELQAIEI